MTYWGFCADSAPQAKISLTCDIAVQVPAGVRTRVSYRLSEFRQFCFQTKHVLSFQPWDLLSGTMRHFLPCQTRNVSSCNPGHALCQTRHCLPCTTRHVGSSKTCLVLQDMTCPVLQDRPRLISCETSLGLAFETQHFLPRNTRHVLACQTGQV